ncbi:uncharacterized protein [Phaseolus vulgaris]|uniref:uncharacterized protein n=1 Tax=Phaseolus vulgaris TaxID=3885 RepID=UPI0035C97898
MTPPVFDGDNYQMWAVRMETYLEALDLWEAVEEEIQSLPENPTVAQIKSQKEQKMKRSKAKACLFAAVSPMVFTRIMSLKSAKEIWDYLKAEYEGDERIRGMQVLNLIREFELQRMEESETIKELWRNKGSQIKQNQQGNEEVVAHNNNKRRNYPPCKHCNKLGHPPFKCWRRPDAKCNKCNQLGHEAVICRNQSEQQDVNQSEQKDVDAQFANEEEDVLFVATGLSNNISSASWLIDSGCTNHMTYEKKLFKELKPSKISKVKIGHGGHISVKGIGTIVVATHSGTKTITDVLYVPNIDQNLLSVGQLLQKGFKVFFEDNHCLIKDATGQDLFKVQMRDKSFSLDLFQEESSDQGLLKMQKSEMEDDPPIKGNRLLSDIYHRCNVAICEPVDHKEPFDHKEVINNPKAEKTMEEEVYMIVKNKTRELVDIPRNRKVHQMDVKSTFINGFLEEEISVEQPKGLIVKGKEDKGYFISLGFDNSLLESASYVKSKDVEWRLSKARMKKK